MNVPRVAIVGKTRSILSWFDDVADGFRRAGAEVTSIPLQAESLAERLGQKRGEGRELFNAEVVSRTAKLLTDARPNLVLVLNKVGLPAPAAEAWRQALGEALPLVGWMCDCLHGRPAGIEPAFDGVYYFDSHSLPAVEDFYQDRNPELRRGYLPLAVNPKRYPLASARKRRRRLVFAGKCSEQRLRTFAELRAARLRIDLYGPGARTGLRFWRSRRLSAASLGKLYRRYMAVLNLPQPPNTEFGLNLRAFEIPCCGGVGIYPALPDVARCFELGEEIIAYRDHDELKEQVDALRSDPARVEAIADAGRQRVLCDHTFECRARKILGDWGFECPNPMV